jgi:hypothetical protein
MQLQFFVHSTDAVRGITCTEHLLLVADEWSRIGIYSEKGQPKQYKLSFAKVGQVHSPY